MFCWLSIGVWFGFVHFVSSTGVLWIQTPARMEKMIGEVADFNWTYQASGVNILSIVWRNQDGGMIMKKMGAGFMDSEAYDGRAQFLGNAGLRISNLVESDSGTYSCLIFDDMGNSLEDTSPPLTVRKPRTEINNCPKGGCGGQNCTNSTVDCPPIHEVINPAPSSIPAKAEIPVIIVVTAVLVPLVVITCMIIFVAILLRRRRRRRSRQAKSGQGTQSTPPEEGVVEPLTKKM